MRRTFALLLMVCLFVLPGGNFAKAEPVDRQQYIFDYAELLTPQEREQLQSLASKLGAERETAFLIVTLKGTGHLDISEYIDEFYDNGAPGYDKPHGNTAMLTIDLMEKEVELTGFKKAEDYLDNDRMDQIRRKITPHLKEARYYESFSTFITTSHKYMGYEPGVDPENILFKWWFQVSVAIGVAGAVVFLMAYHSGGRVTVNQQTYLDGQRSRVVDQSDRYVRQTVTKRKKPSSNSRSSGGGGGGGSGRVTPGGHSRSSSRGKF
ncbi:hypothetical protein BEP19_11820 [Ammoniphilus oxalaticus]|uniref:TPM domain-containing protein n=1 Tax=Ammoniphilus oxalaticus TaxID=66863 RepID=A0A419SGK0_9BACL|nr:TPM domain-containing protein [Ammoniphilus oxalaticus]RKD22917.1 hypothetical protein BEP19_11820 [Ammoniphilus oxalaticus]